MLDWLHGLSGWGTAGEWSLTWVARLGYFGLFVDHAAFTLLHGFLCSPGLSILARALQALAVAVGPPPATLLTPTP